MKVQAMNDLIERLEKATGPDRALADDILLACGWRIEEHGDGPNPAVVWIDPNPNGEDYIAGDQPDPTASIDAALTLVPADWAQWWKLGRGKITRYGAILRRYRDGADHDEVGANGATPAIALCIVALKARAALTVHDR